MQSYYRSGYTHQQYATLEEDWPCKINKSCNDDGLAVCVVKQAQPPPKQQDYILVHNQWHDRTPQYSESWYENQHLREAQPPPKQQDYVLVHNQGHDRTPQYSESWYENQHLRGAWRGRNDYPGHDEGHFINPNDYSNSSSQIVGMSGGYGAHQGSRVTVVEYQRPRPPPRYVAAQTTTVWRY